MRVTALAVFSEAADKELHKAETSRVRSVHGAVTEQSGGQAWGGEGADEGALHSAHFS